MNRINHYVLNGAIALLSTAGFVACSSSDDVTDAPVNPSYDGKSVKTQFAINIATPVTGNPSTRMSDKNTQNGTSGTNDFLGMNNILLMPFKSTDVLNVTKSNAERTSATQIDQVIALGDIANTALSTSQSSKIYYDVNIPINTGKFLFYGTGPLGTDNSSRFEKGALAIPTNNSTSNLSGNQLSAINYSLITCLSQNSGFTTKAGKFAEFLTGICGASCEYNSTTYSWNNLDSYTSSSSKFATLKKAYDDFITIGSTGVRAGSGPAVLYVLQELYDICQGVCGGTVSDTEPATGAEEKLAWNIIKLIKGNTNIPISVTSGVLSYTNDEDKIFPVGTYAIPEGAAQLKYESNKFSYATTSEIGNGSLTPKLSFDPAKVTFPAALTYFVNTPARATTAELTNADWPATVAIWDGAWDASTGTFKDWTTTVNSNSRTVALQYNINYGVACLATKVQCKYGAAYLEDNAGVITSNVITDQQIEIPNDGFKVTGILIGGQSQTVGWDFLDPSKDNQVYVVYDKDINGTTGMTAKAETQTATNYTLVFDNYVTADGATIGSDNDQQKVKIAIELQNGDEEFYGVDGKIGKNQKFYLVAELDPNGTTGVTNSITWPEATKSNFPATGITRVFIQDYTTKATFTINSLKNAYVTIPDLRASNLQLGLSVDLTWQTGLTFDVPIN